MVYHLLLLCNSGGFRRTKPKRRDFVNSDDDVTNDVSDDEVKIKPKAKSRPVIPKKKAKPASVKIGSGGKKDIVEDLHLSDIE